MQDIKLDIKKIAISRMDGQKISRKMLWSTILGRRVEEPVAIVAGCITTDQKKAASMLEGTTYYSSLSTSGKGKFSEMIRTRILNALYLTIHSNEHNNVPSTLGGMDMNLETAESRFLMSTESGSVWQKNQSPYYDHKTKRYCFDENRAEIFKETDRVMDEVGKNEQKLVEEKHGDPYNEFKVVEYKFINWPEITRDMAYCPKEGEIITQDTFDLAKQQISSKMYLYENMIKNAETSIAICKELSASNKTSAKECKNLAEEVKEFNEQKCQHIRMIRTANASLILLDNAHKKWIAAKTAFKAAKDNAKIVEYEQRDKLDKARLDHDIILAKMMLRVIPNIKDYPNSLPIEDLKEGKHIIIAQEWVEMQDGWAELLICDDGKSYYISRLEDVINNTYACESNKFIILKEGQKITIIPISSLEQNACVKAEDIVRPNGKLSNMCGDAWVNIDALGCVGKTWYALIFGTRYNLVDLLNVGEDLPFDEKNVTKINKITVRIKNPKRAGIQAQISDVEFTYNGAIYKFNTRSGKTAKDNPCRLVSSENGSAFTSLKLL